MSADSLIQIIEAACTDHTPYGSTKSISRGDAERIAKAIEQLRPTGIDSTLVEKMEVGKVSNGLTRKMDGWNEAIDMCIAIVRQHQVIQPGDAVPDNMEVQIAIAKAMIDPNGEKTAAAYAKAAIAAMGDAAIGNDAGHTGTTGSATSASAGTTSPTSDNAYNTSSTPLNIEQVGPSEIRYNDDAMHQDISRYLGVWQRAKLSTSVAATVICHVFRPYLRTTEPVSIKDGAEAVKAVFDLSLVGPDSGFKSEDVAEALAKKWRLAYVD